MDGRAVGQNATKGDTRPVSIGRSIKTTTRSYVIVSFLAGGRRSLGGPVGTQGKARQIVGPEKGRVIGVPGVARRGPGHGTGENAGIGARGHAAGPVTVQGEGLA